ncbi:energy-coupling factor transporter ATPase [Paenibacillus physcomitrellae]|uniref:Energy-coupling factor transporter ATP-binding protein EcfA1 n=1 Tax=Paenibacillus physcomitrellae TaxID=1619311 RepID=A0ABQ1FWJ5_9BACL|nr:energy-coupling factor transporter ATPase [Paenibacillus physcomitrellae]GGA31702.1 energy-coupling factor transporter ATP-binding protein EcfA1 [Paenibacillus physcomitrellae]
METGHIRKESNQSHESESWKETDYRIPEFSSEPVLRFENLTFAYGKRKEPAVLQNASASILAGSWISLVGPNGCGKSTLAKLLGGLLRPQAGRIWIEGEELTPLSAYRLRRKIGMVFQNPENQFIGATVEEDIAFGLEGQCLPRCEMRSRVNSYARKLGIEQLLHKHPGELSGGQKQRVAVASVLAMQPKVVIFDEASSMLDEKSRRELLEVLKELKETGGYTLISITHDADEVLQSDRVLVLEEGGIREDLRPEELFARKDLLASCRLSLPFRIQMQQALGDYGIRLSGSMKGGSLEEILCPLFSRT